MTGDAEDPSIGEGVTSKKYFISPDILKGAKLYPGDDRSIFTVGKRQNPMLTVTDETYNNSKNQRFSIKR
jgi:hypothetical protein